MRLAEDLHRWHQSPITGIELIYFRDENGNLDCEFVYPEESRDDYYDGMDPYELMAQWGLEGKGL